ncbi:uncharacterized protein F5Z01DRAFT_116362 [Emericellopsis atlantica]|uniref:Uncharacterized protein n=1 Tax=Emericellopsis atlantica TaxID=2614577 RepID=A0A9P7ZL93_9HYPO|nr:uncharacterized protein F5Z01DRAFT_116362 [Emericellopsis atlantica]KAG9254080.1 hypothetical protein F5Z01DRAFT_116362 [Emericellopsis atlantica]
MSQPIRSTDGAMLFIFSVLSTAELALGLLCASLPAYVYFFPGFDRPSTHGVKLNISTGAGIRHLRPPRHHADISVKITGGRTRGPRRSGIVVMDEVGMTRHENVNGAWRRRVLNDDEDDEKALMPSRHGVGGVMKESDVPGRAGGGKYC